MVNRGAMGNRTPIFMKNIGGVRMYCRSIYYVKVLVLSIYAIDAYFDLVVETQRGKVHAMDIDPMCDAYNVYDVDTGKVRLTVIPTDKYHNAFKDYEAFSVVLDKDLAREVVKAIRDAEDDKMWFTKDRLSYAATYGEVI